MEQGENGAAQSIECLALGGEPVTGWTEGND
jgi:hypothetical protein